MVLFCVRRVIRARCTWDRAQADDTKPGHRPQRAGLPTPRRCAPRYITCASFFALEHVCQQVHSKRHASLVHANVRHRRARARTRATLAGKRTMLLETPCQPRPCQRLGSQPQICSRRHASTAHANVSAQTGPRSSAGFASVEIRDM